MAQVFPSLYVQRVNVQAETGTGASTPVSLDPTLMAWANMLQFVPTAESWSEKVGLVFLK